MPRAVEFHTGVPDTLAYACRLLRKAYRSGTRIVCLAPKERLEALDRALWTFVERDFVPHAISGRAAAPVLERTPIWLAEAMPAAGGSTRHSVVVNVGGVIEPDAAAEVRIIEIVGAEADEVERGRAVWRQYKAAGFDIVHHPYRAQAARDD